MPRTAEAQVSEHPAIPPSELSGRDRAPQILPISDYQKYSFSQLMGIMTEKDWEDCIVYLYRLKPEHTRLGGQGNENLAKYTHPVTEDAVGAEFGGGLYKVMLRKGNKGVATGRFEIPGEPKWTENERPKTKDAEISKQSDLGAMTSLLNSILERQENQMRFMMERFEEHSERLLEAVKTDRAGESTAIGEAIKVMSLGAQKGIETLAGIKSEEGVTAKDLFDAFAKGQQLAPKAPDTLEQVKNAIELAKMVNPQTAASANPIEQIKNVVEAAKTLQEEFGGGSGNSKLDFWRGLVEVIVPAAKDFAQTWAMSRRPVIANPASRPSFEAVPEVIPPITHEPTAPPPRAAAPASGIEDRAVRLKQQVVKIFQSGMSGEFLCEYLQLESPEIWVRVKAVALEGPAALIQTFQGDTILAIIAQDEGLPQFVGEMIEYIKHEEPGEPEPVAAETPAENPGG